MKAFAAFNGGFMSSIIEMIAGKLAERSTWVGLTLLVTSVTGWQMPELLAEPVTMAGMGIAAILLVIVKGKRVK